MVTGGTGFVGKALVDGLIAAEWTPRLLRRALPGQSRPTTATDPSRHPIPPDPRAVECRVVDFSDAERLAEACRGAFAIIHLVGIIAELGDNTFRKAHVGLTHRMVRAAHDAGVARFLQMSALGTRPGARSRYHQTKWEAEEIVRASGLDWTIFRPSLIHARHGGFVGLFDQLSRYSPFLPVLGGGRALQQPIGLGAVARAFVRALRVPLSIGQTYELCSPERLEFREIQSAILEALGRRRFLLPVPFPLARIQARVLEFVWPRLLRRAPPLHRDQILMLEEDNVGDGGPADAAFGLVHPSFREGLADSPRLGA